MTAIFGTVKNLVAGTITLSLPAGHRYWFIQNQDTAPLVLTTTGRVGGPVLNAALATGAAGEWIDTHGFPFLESITLTSTLATAQFGAWSSPNEPLNTFVDGDHVYHIRSA